jgi:hypothetical protein
MLTIHYDTRETSMVTAKKLMYGIIPLGIVGSLLILQSMPGESVRPVQDATSAHTDTSTMAIDQSMTVGSSPSTHRSVSANDILINIESSSPSTLNEETDDALSLNNIEQLQASEILATATFAVERQLPFGPLTACFDKMRSFACPIVGAMPVVKDIVGAISLELGVSCPTSLNPPQV